MYSRFFGALFLLMAVIGCDSAESGPTTTLTESRIERLSRGINTSHWFAQTELTPGRFTSFIRPSDIRLIKDVGFHYIRFSLDPMALFDEESPASLDVISRHHLDNAISMILAEDLGVVVDLHPESSFKARMEGDREFFEKVKTFWGVLAKHLSVRDPEYVFLEVMNEPEYDDATEWQNDQAELIEVMRANAPNHTIIASGPRWSAVTELIRIEPVDDPNVVYNFHLYDPHDFTHQGATWGAQHWRHLRDLPYPSSPELLAPVIPTLPESVRNIARGYGEARWNRDRIAAFVQPVVDWANEHGVHLTCNEFGVYRLIATPESRNRWLADVTSVLEENDIGWAMWDYAGGFSVVNDEGGVRVPDAGTVEALGL